MTLNSNSIPDAKIRQTRPRGDERRRRILEVAVDLFGARGFNDVGIAEISAAVGITPAGLRHHFPTKVALLLAVLQQREFRVEQALDRYMESAEDFITAFLHVLEDNEKSPALVQLFAVLSAESLSSTHPGHEWFVARYEETIRVASEHLTHLIDESALPPGATTETVARWIHGMADGLRIQWLLNPGSLNRHETVAQFALLLHPYFKKKDQ